MVNGDKREQSPGPPLSKRPRFCASNGDSSPLWAEDFMVEASRLSSILASTVDFI